MAVTTCALMLSLRSRIVQGERADIFAQGELHEDVQLLLIILDRIQGFHRIMGPVLTDEIHPEHDLVLGHDLLAGHVQLQLPHVGLEDGHGGRPFPEEIIPRLEQPL